MGYTHYWTAKPISSVAWSTVKTDMQKLFAASRLVICREYDEPNEWPVADDDEIRFNGREEAGHETFLVDRHSSDFSFCKTAHKPYDVAVTAVLIYLSSLCGYVVQSDGDETDFASGLKLARKVWPNLIPQLNIPSTLAD